jgi:hypothetical protein
VGGEAAEEGKMLHSERAYSSSEIEASSSLEWQCAECTLLNKLDSYNCSACGKLFEYLRRHLERKERPQASEYIPKPTPKTSCKTCYRKATLVDEQCKDCREGEDAKEARAKLHYSQSAEAWSWDCGNCGRGNHESRRSCMGCNYPKERRFMVVCKECNRRNPNDFPTCESCFASMRGHSPPNAKLEAPRRYLEICWQCQTRNPDDLPNCGNCFGSLNSPSLSPPKTDLEQPRRYSETCGRCQTRNTGDTPLCENCLKPMLQYESGVRPAPALSKPSSNFAISRPSPPALKRLSPAPVLSSPSPAQIEGKRLLEFEDSCSKCMTPNTRERATCVKCYASLIVLFP